MFFIDDPPGSELIEGSAEDEDLGKDDFSGKGEDDEDAIAEEGSGVFTNTNFAGSGGGLIYLRNAIRCDISELTQLGRADFVIHPISPESTTPEPTLPPTTTTTTPPPPVLTKGPPVVFVVSKDDAIDDNLLPELTPEPTDDTEMDNDIPMVVTTGFRHSSRQVSFFGQPGMLAAVIGGAVVGLLCAILLVMFIVYRMRKKDEGSYPLDEPKRSPSSTYTRSSHNKEFYA
ncbi:SDC2 [Cordylochernes scorpioides]|uniref:Syndecan n=1 Tax=Cordylochernes scorpioides TaxID=51811 RepID=A0ABY6LQL1_9ARAC|nr:SDC2 [Cordylochernes scorpioides]